MVLHNHRNAFGHSLLQKAAFPSSWVLLKAPCFPLTWGLIHTHPFEKTQIDSSENSFLCVLASLMRVHLLDFLPSVLQLVTEKDSDINKNNF